ncbi:phosphoglycerate mutase [Ramlibacter agri]|uniref:phosphoglycerate mutase n=1 Tax=Ramlibacter agri TaxID=2728837 RepID=UPI001981BD2F|nr:phosphoglycerate mutase [Ramlibacter agri]
MIVPFAGSSAAGCVQALRGLALPNLQKLLARLQPAGSDAGNAESLSMPHETALARACGLPAADGLVPLAAWQVRQQGGDPGQAESGAGTASGAGWAWITPAHWRVGRDRIAMAHPQELALDEAYSRGLLAAMAPYFTEDGIELRYDTPTRWLARADIFRDLPTASLDRVGGADIDPWLPRSAAAGPLRRLQQEMQMLLYTLPLSEERERAGHLPVNSFWISGTGALPPDAPAQPPASLRVPGQLREAALVGDWPAWATAWQQLDARECAQLLQDLDAGRAVQLTLCGEAHARTWASAGASFWRRAAALFNKPSAAALLEAL